MAADFARSVLTLMTFEGEALHARQRAEQLWTRLKRRTPAERLLLVEKTRGFRNWALCERVTVESRELAPNQPRQALEAAQLAVRIAELIPGDVAWSHRLQGWALFHVANGHRACQDLNAARHAFSRAQELWAKGASGDPGLLNEAVPLWIEAALRRDERRFPEALKRIDEALALEHGDLRAHMLLSKSAIFHALGEPQSLAATLAEAALLIDPARELLLAFALRYNLVEALVQIGSFEQAAASLDEVQDLADRLGEVLQLQRVIWLRGKVSTGLGRHEDAELAFRQVRHIFQEHQLAFDYALVSMDLALLLLETGRSGEVIEMAQEMLRIFDTLQVQREALVALGLFCNAALQGTATADMARRIARFLKRLQHDPGLTFEAEEGAGVA
jgi:tetratricopeptide (TPR) repeat protein